MHISKTYLIGFEEHEFEVYRYLFYAAVGATSFYLCKTGVSEILEELQQNEHILVIISGILSEYALFKHYLDLKETKNQIVFFSPGEMAKLFLLKFKNEKRVHFLVKPVKDESEQLRIALEHGERFITKYVRKLLHVSQTYLFYFNYNLKTKDENLLYLSFSGFEVKEIADCLSCSEKTVLNRRRRLLDKFHAKNLLSLYDIMNHVEKSRLSE